MPTPKEWQGTWSTAPKEIALRPSPRPGEEEPDRGALTKAKRVPTTKQASEHDDDYLLQSGLSRAHLLPVSTGDAASAPATQLEARNRAPAHRVIAL